MLGKLNILVCLLTIILPSQPSIASEKLDEKWTKFKKEYGRRFIGLKEERFRKAVFLKNLEEVEVHNEKYIKGLETYNLTINQFSDSTEEELKPYFSGLAEPILLFLNNSQHMVEAAVDVAIPNSIDWRSKGVVTPVKNQGKCGSCWAFAATGALEAHYKIYKHLSVTLSEQQLVDCTSWFYGCNGGWPNAAFAYITRNKGLNHDSFYPYRGYKWFCRYNPKKPNVGIRNYATLAKPDEEALKAIVATKGPVAVAIDAGGPWGGFMSYSSGVFYNPRCSRSRPNHAVVIVGYGSEKGEDYWLVKNSWGAKWGDQGYIKMARNRANNCLIASFVSYPVM